MPTRRRKNARSTRRFAALLLSGTLLSCGTPESQSARDVRMTKGAAAGRVVTQAELQQDIERFAERLLDASADAAVPLATTDMKTREAAVRQVTRYASSVVDIASGATPEINLLDMIVFVRLSRHMLDDYWVPKVFGDKGRPLARAFADGEKDLWTVSGKVLGPDEQAKLRSLIDQWIEAHPDRVRIASTRLSDFSLIAGQLSEQHAKEAGGLFGSVKSATVAADEAVLLGQRAMFVAHRMPFLIRLQARLGASEVVSDSLDRIGEMKSLAETMPEAQTLLADLKTLVRDSKTTVVEAQSALRALEPVLAEIPPQEQLQETIRAATRVTEKADVLLGNVRALIPANPEEMIPAVTVAADRLVRRWAVYFALVGAAWSLMFWGGYYVAKRLTATR